MKFKIYSLLLTIICFSSINAMEKTEDFFSEGSLKKSYHIATKFENYLLQIGEDELNKEELQYLHDSLHGRYKVESCETAEDTKNLFENRKNGLFNQFTNDIIEYVCDNFHREPIEFNQYPIGIIHGFFKVEGKEQIAQNPFSFAHAVVLSSKTLLTAKHVFDVPNWQNFDSILWPENFDPNTEKMVPTYLFSYPQDEKKDTRIYIKNHIYLKDEVSYGPSDMNLKTFEFDISLAYLEKELPLLKSASLSPFLKQQDSFLLHLENKDDYYSLYRTNNIAFFEFSELKNVTYRLKSRVFIDKYLKPGVSGTGVLFCKKEDSFNVIGVYNGKININDNDCINKPVFHFSPITKDTAKTLEENIE